MARFVLDHNVDADLIGLLTAAGHEAWTAQQAGLHLEADDTISIYADQQGAVVLTHDRNFTTRRREKTIGKHIRLACREIQACAVMSRHMAEISRYLRSRGAWVLVVRPERVQYHAARWPGAAETLTADPDHPEDE